MSETLAKKRVIVIDSNRLGPYICQQLHSTYGMLSTFHLRRDDGRPEAYENSLARFMGKADFGVIHATADDFKNVINAHNMGKRPVVLARTDKAILRQIDLDAYKSFLRSGIPVVEKPERIDFEFISQIARGLLSYLS